MPSRQTIVFIDVDGVLNWFEDTPRGVVTIHWREGRWDFLRWAAERFECRFLTEWMGLIHREMPPEFRFPVEDYRDCKTEAIERLMEREPGRGWFWLDDDILDMEEAWLAERGVMDRWIRVDPRDSGDLKRVRERLEREG